MGCGVCRLFFIAVAGTLIFHGFCSTSSEAQGPHYTFMHEATTAPPISHYDYIIIGGGTAGCPLAATLSQNSSVLLLERGGSPYGNPNITDLSAFGKALSDLSRSSPSQRFVSEDGVINARARVLGGGSCINAGFYTRAADDYVAAAGWDHGLVEEAYGWVERVVAFEPQIREWQAAVRDGLVEVGVSPYNGFTYDHLNGTKIGGTIFDGDGRRHTAADLLKYANPKGLNVFLHASVHKILFRIKGKKKPVAHGVIFRDALGEKHKAYLKSGPNNEVILSAGALGSPQLLMLSGIGPMGQLKAHNITVVLGQPLVGQGMSDNPMNAIFIPSPIPVELSLIQVVGVTRFGGYIEAASGADFTGNSGSSQMDFGMFSPKIGQLSTVPPNQRNPKTLNQAIKAMEALPPSAFRGGFILEKISSPLSKGHLYLKTKNPNDNPSVTFNYFSNPKDLQTCVDGLKVIANVIESKSFAPFRYDFLRLPMLLNMTASAPVNLLPRHANDSASLEQFCRDTVMTIWHYHGGCRVGEVVDSKYKVFGVEGLRVVDGSTFLGSPGTNPQATVMMLGRYMGVKILKERFD